MKKLNLSFSSIILVFGLILVIFCTVKIKLLGINVIEYSGLDVIGKTFEKGPSQVINLLINDKEKFWLTEKSANDTDIDSVTSGLWQLRFGCWLLIIWISFNFILFPVKKLILLTFKK